MFKTKTLNLRSQDRANNSTAVHDGRVSVNKCHFILDKPISLKERGLVGLRSAYFPITFKNIDSTNDRFVLKFLPAHTSAIADCVFVACQLQHGYYNSSAAIQVEVNRVLGLLNATTPTSIDNNLGGISNQYSADTTAILSNDMTCVLGSGDNDLAHLVITLPDGVVFSATGVKSADDSAIGNTGLDGGFQILFGDQKGGGERFPVSGRTAHRVMGFGQELTKPQTAGGDDFVASPAVAGDRDGTAVQILTSDFIANQMRTPYIYVRSNLSRDCRESSKNGNQTNLLQKIPVKNSTYGSMEFYEPSEGDTLYFVVEAGDYSNVEITLTDGDDKLLVFDQNDWELMLTFKGEFYN